jgi:hypothetical protein
MSVTLGLMSDLITTLFYYNLRLRFLGFKS